MAISNRQDARFSSWRHGSAIALVLIVIVMLSVTGFTALRIGSDSRLRTIRENADARARYAADSGVNRTVYLMNQALEEGQWDEAGIPEFNSETLPGIDADYTTTVSGSFETGYIITSTGRAGQAERTIQARTTLENIFSLNFAILAQSTIDLKAHSSIRGYNSSDLTQTDLKADIGTISQEDRAVAIRPGVELSGDVYIGPESDPETVVISHQNSQVEGEVLRRSFPPPMTVVESPQLSFKGSLSGSDITLTSQDSGAYTNINIDNGGILSIEGHCVLVVSEDINLRNSAQITIAEGGSLTVYLEGDFHAVNSAGIYNENAIPETFKLYGTGSQQSIDLKNSTDFYGVVYAPNADMVLHNDGNAYGSFIVDDFELKNSGTIYYDAALRDADLADDTARFMMIRREEL